MPQSGRSIASSEARKEAPIGYGEFPVPRIIAPVNSQNFPVIRLREFAASIWFRELICGFSARSAANRKNSRFCGNVTGAARSSSIGGGGVLLVPLIAPRRRVDRLRQ